MALALISGGSGLVGTALSRELVRKGHRVIVLTRDPMKQSLYGESVVWDGIHPGIWMEWVQKTDWIVNLAGANIGEKRWTGERWQEIRDSRVFSGELLTEAVLRSSRRPSVMLQMSAIGYYGTQNDRDTTEWDENAPPGNDRVAELCREWEASSSRVEELGVRRLIARTGLVLTRKAGVLPKIEIPFRFFMGGPMGNGRQVYSWIHIDDLVHAMVFLLENSLSSGAYNFTAPGLVSNSEFSRILGRVMHRPSWFSVPAFLLRLALGDMSSLILDGQRAIPKRLLKDAGYQFKYPDLSSALNNLYH